MDCKSSPAGVEGFEGVANEVAVAVEPGVGGGVQSRGGQGGVGGTGAA